MSDWDRMITPEELEAAHKNLDASLNSGYRAAIAFVNPTLRQSNPVVAHFNLMVLTIVKAEGDQPARYLIIPHDDLVSIEDRGDGAEGCIIRYGDQDSPRTVQSALTAMEALGC